MTRFTMSEGIAWTIDDYFSEIGRPERFDLASKWIYETRKLVADKKLKGAVDVVVIVNSHKPINPLNNAALQYIYTGINQEIDPEKSHAIREFSVRNFLVPEEQNKTVEVLIYDDSDKS